MKPTIDSQGRKLCTAHRTDGEPCRGPAIKGGNVCRVHGGSIGHVKEAARRRLQEAVDPLMGRLIEIALDNTEPVKFTCTECGEDNVQNVGFNVRDSLVAIRDALDRAGLGAVRQVEVVTLDAIDAEIRRLEAELGMEHVEWQEVDD